MLFCPSPRDIEPVKESWKKIPFDKFVVKNKLEETAYREGKQFFLDHTEYTHLVVCPDDLEIDYESFCVLFHDVNTQGYPTIAGISNIDETQPDTYCCKPLGLDYSADKPDATKGTFYETNTLPNECIFEVGDAAFTCQWISRGLMKKLSFSGINGGYMDWKFSKECHKLGIPQMVDKRATFYHRRFEQKKQLMEWLKGPHPPDEGHSFLMRF